MLQYIYIIICLYVYGIALAIDPFLGPCIVSLDFDSAPEAAGLLFELQGAAMACNAVEINLQPKCAQQQQQYSVGYVQIYIYFIYMYV